MINKPIINALMAIIYIVAIVLVISGISTLSMEDKAGLMIPIAMLSLFTLSASVMGYLFIFTPVALYLDGKKKESVNYLLQTIGWFAGMTFLIWVIVALLSF